MNIIVRIYSFLLFSAFLAVFIPSSVAQDSVEEIELRCAIVKEAIVKLRRPFFNTPTVWNAFYGQDGMEQIADVVLGDEGSFIVAGSYTKDKEDNDYKPFLAKIDGRGRVIWESRQETKNKDNQKAGMHKTIQALSKTKNGYAVIGNVISGANKVLGFYLGVYTKEGKLIREIPFYQAGYSLKALSFAPSKSGKSYIISASKEKGGKKEAVLYKITLTGKKLWRRQYSPGLTTQFHNIHRASDGNYTLAGEIEMKNKRMAGWVARIDDNGALLWQQTYPRGRDATFMNAHTNKDNTIIVSGQVKGIGKKENAAWVMKLNDDASVLWQRYYQGSAHYSAPSLIGYDDGRVSVLLNGVKIKKHDRGHVRVITVSPRGEMIDGQSFTDGQNAQGYSLKLGHSGERLVVGYAQISMPDDMVGKKMPPHVFDGWIFAATPFDLYVNICTREF